MRSLAKFNAWIGEGYRQHQPGVFRARLLWRWSYVVTGTALVDELRKAPEDVLSFAEASRDNIQSDYTLGDWRTGVRVDPMLLQTKLSRRLPQIFPAAAEEMDAAFTEEITSRLGDGGWTTIVVGEPIMRIVCRTTTRLLVGLPLCRQREFVDLNIRFAIDVMTSLIMLRWCPAFLKPAVSRFIIPVRRTFRRAEHIMGETINYHLRQSEMAGSEWQDGKPDDYLQWSIDLNEPLLRDVPALSAQILHVNFAAVHTTAASFTFALYQLAAHQQKYQEPLRREAQAALAAHGWTRSAMDALHLADSFLREALRFHGVTAVSLDRKALHDYRFQDGTRVPAGSMVCAATRATHRDPALYPNPDAFDGFRFCGEGDGQRMTATSTAFLAFGGGRHVCPGRFWAAAEMKAMLAYMVTHYDMRMEHDGTVPEETWIASYIVPDRKARMLFRGRAAPSL